MDRIDTARARLEHASGLPAVLDAAYDAFEDMLGVIEAQQDPGGGAFAAFVMAGAAAANGRNAVAAAPSLPPAPSGDLARTAAGSSGVRRRSHGLSFWPRKRTPSRTLPMLSQTPMWIMTARWPRHA